MRRKIGTMLILAVALWICPGLSLASTGFAACSEDTLILPAFHNRLPAFTGVDVLIDAGHGGIDSGTVSGTIAEKDINLAIAQKTYKNLQKMGYRTVLNRIGDYALSNENGWLRIRSRHKKDLAQRSHLAGEIKPKLMLSLHVNASRRSSIRGPLMLHQKNEQSKPLATILQNTLNPLYGVDEKPRYGRTYYLLRHTKVPTVIVEMGFLTNPQDRDLLTRPDGQEQIARLICKGLRPI
ncbi:N-acetylmuramoyl-L-alanine amidase [Paenibacillus sp. P26]|nr:N-acetylmuramoyl-L-alanine amidase [Paenibacillus sp. P26]